MSAYYILTQTVTDVPRYFRYYVSAVVPILQKHKAEIVVGEMEAKPVQGNPAKGVVVVRFPSEQAVYDFLADPEYQPILKIRLALTENASAVVAPAFVPPT